MQSILLHMRISFGWIIKKYGAKMNKESFKCYYLLIKLLTVILVFTALLFTACQPEQKQKPNIIFIIADDLGYGDLGCYGQQHVKTPHIDALAAEGMRFTQHYAGCTVCAPSRCSLMTGMHTGHTIVRGNYEIQPEGQYPLPAETVTAAELLKQAGYATAIVGKWGLGGPGSSGVPNRQGFDYFYGYLCQRKAHFYYPEYLWRNEQRVDLVENRDGEKGIYAHDLLTKEALGFIKQNKDHPFFLYLPYTIPHAELVLPDDEFFNMYKNQFEETPFPGGHYGAQAKPMAAFAGMVSRMDADVGRIRALLKELNLFEQTLIIFTSDNGPHQEGGHDPAFFNSSGLLRGIKRDLYEGGIRVPFIASWPGVIQAGTTSDHVSAFWDFLPTCAELAGIDTPEYIDGISLLPTFMGNNNDQKQHGYLYWEFHEGKGSKQALRFDNWKAVSFLAENRIELYDLETDPREQHDLAAQQPDVIQQAQKLMKEARTPSVVWPLRTK
jgi:arylsulfatase A